MGNTTTKPATWNGRPIFCPGCGILGKKSQMLSDNSDYLMLRCSTRKHYFDLTEIAIISGKKGEYGEQIKPRDKKV